MKAGPGRPPGSRNKATAKREAEIAATGITPLQYMLNRMRSDTLAEADKFAAAVAAAPYVHPKLSTVQMEATIHSDVSDEPEPMTKDTWQTETSRFVQ